MASTVISDIVVPEVFSAYQNQKAADTAKIVQSGAMARDGIIDGLMAQGGTLVEIPSWQALASTDANIAVDTYATQSTPENLSTSRESAAKLSRNQSWASPDLLASLAGEDPMKAAAAMTGVYWGRVLQKGALAVLAGIVAHNEASDSGDFVVDVSGASYIAGTTDFSAGHAIDARSTMGELEDDLGVVIMHPVVYARARKNNLIDGFADSANPLAAQFQTFLGHKVVLANGMPAAGGVYDTYFLAPGFLKLGMGAPKNPLELERDASRGNGSGLEVLYNRVEFIIHPVGHRFIGTLPATGGGPSNAATSNNLAAAGSWDRVFPARELCGISVLRTRES